MDVVTQRTHITNFYRSMVSAFCDEALSIVVVKGPDYAPERIAMTEAFFTAAAINATVPQILYVHVRKHMSAIATYMQTGGLNSEDIRSRLRDVANYMALIDSYLDDPISWLRHLDRLIALGEFNHRSSEEMNQLLQWVHHQMVVTGALVEPTPTALE